MNKAFFEKEARKKIVKKKKTPQNNCEVCGLYKNCKSPKMKYSGQGRKDILIILESPSEIEDDRGIQCIGESGKILRDTLKNYKINLERDCYKVHAVACKMTKNKKINAKIMNACRKRLHVTIKKTQPEKIIVLGRIALETLLGDKIKKIGTMSKWIGRAIPDQDLNAWIYTTYNPSDIVKFPNDQMYEKFFRENISFAIDHDVVFVPDKNNEKYIEIIKNPFAAIIFMQGILDGSEVVLDIETTGQKPHRKGHEIYTISFAISETRCVAFPFFEDKEFRIILKRFFLNKNIKKIAHNLKFEDAWLSFFLKMEIKNWWFDTIIAAHILDNRSGITGLKDQTYFNFGIAGYDDEIAPYLKSKNKGGNEINRIKEADLDKVLLYNGLDSLYTYRLYKKQIQEMSVADFEAYNFFHNATLSFCDIEKTGVCADMQHYYKREKILTKKIDRYHDDIMQSKEIEIWEKNKPEKLKEKHKKKWEPFNLNSTQQKAYLFFDLLGFESSKKTVTGNNSTDIEALEGIDNDFIQKISRRKKLLTLRDTHLAGFIREECDGKIHTSYNLNTVVTFRGSSSGPNLQNVPVRDKLALSICRGGVVPSPGNEIVSIDYGGIEVKVSACNHRDPAMLAECFEPDKYDMHRDMAAELFLMERGEVSKDARFFAKNNFVFAQFYGDYYVNCAKNLWKSIDEKIMDHLRKKGIKSYNQFEKKVQDVEYHFWQERFKVYYKWKEKTWKKYLKEGKIELLSGFVCRGHMRKNEILNYGIQGPAFHILLWSIIEVNKFLKKEKTKTKIIGQIHDEMLLDMCLKEKKYLKPVIKKIMTEDVKKAFPWIITPLVLDMEVSDVDGNWANMKEEKI